MSRRSSRKTDSLEVLALERVQLTIDLCDILWRQHELDRKIAAAIELCTTSPELREELARQCFYRARRKLRPELVALEDLAASAGGVM